MKRTFEEIKKEFYDFKKEADIHYEGLRDPIYDYVQILEEREKKFIDFIILLFEYEITDTCISDFIEEITQKPIDEVIRENGSGTGN